MVIDQAASIPTVLPALGIARHPLIPDANALIEDIIHYAGRQLATGRGYSRLTFLTGIGAARAFVPVHIPDKVDIHLERAAEDCCLDVELAYEIWDTVLRPLLTVVELPAITDAEDPRVLAFSPPIPRTRRWLSSRLCSHPRCCSPATVTCWTPGSARRVG